MWPVVLPVAEARVIVAALGDKRGAHLTNAFVNLGNKHIHDFRIIWLKRLYA
jgi:hypothetical protein